MSQKQQDRVEQQLSSLEDDASAIPPSSSIPDTPQSETVQEDTPQSETVQEDTPQSETVQEDTLQPETVQEDTPQPETVQEDTPQPETAQETEKPQSPLVVSGKKRGRKKGRLVSVEEIMPKPSYWPLALAVSFVVLSMGIVISWIVIVIGAVLVIASIMGWSLERR